jgi:hypothetical protein
MKRHPEPGGGGEEKRLRQTEPDHSFGIPDYGMPHHGMPVYGMPHHGMPVYGMPHHGMQPHGMPHHGMPVYGMPHHGMPVYGMPHHGMPVYGMPHHGMPHHGMPHHGMPVYGMPHHGMHPHGMHQMPASSSSEISASSAAEMAASSSSAISASSPAEMSASSSSAMSASCPAEMPASSSSAMESPKLDMFAQIVLSETQKKKETFCIYSNDSRATYPVSQGVVLKKEGDFWTVKLTKPMFDDRHFYLKEGSIVKYHKTFFKEGEMTSAQLKNYREKMKKKLSPSSVVKIPPTQEETDLMNYLQYTTEYPVEDKFVFNSDKSFLEKGERVWVTFRVKDDSDENTFEMWYAGNVVKVFAHNLTVVFDDGERKVINTKTRKWIPAPIGIKK